MSHLLKINSFIIGLLLISSLIFNVELSFEYKTIFYIIGISSLISISLIYMYEVVSLERIKKDYKIYILIGILSLFLIDKIDYYFLSLKDKSSLIVISDINISSISQNKYISIDKTTAITLAYKEMNNQKYLSSIINKEMVSLQNINGTLEWVIPLNYKNFNQKLSNDTIPGYILVSATNHMDNVKFVSNKNIIISSNSYLLNNINRIAYFKSGLKKCNTYFEIDDSGHPYYVSLILDHKHGYIGYKVNNVLLTDAVTGITNKVNIDEIHKKYMWIDHLTPEYNLKNEIRWNGLFKFGLTDYILDGAKSTKMVNNKFSYIDINGSLSYFTGIVKTQSKYRDLFKDLNNTSLSYGLFTDIKSGTVSRIDLKANIDNMSAYKLIVKYINADKVLIVGDLSPVIIENKLYYGCSVFSKEGLFDRIVLIEAFDNHIIFPGTSFKEIIDKITHTKVIANHNSIENIVVDQAIYREIYKQIQDMELKESKMNNPSN